MILIPSLMVVAMGSVRVLHNMSFFKTLIAGSVAWLQLCVCSRG